MSDAPKLEYYCEKRTREYASEFPRSTRTYDCIELLRVIDESRTQIERLRAALAAREADGGKSVELPAALVVTAEGSRHDYYAEGWNDCRRKVRELAARDAAPVKDSLTTAQSVAVPDGFVMVPVEPTTDMLIAGVKANYGRDGVVGSIYSAMLAASQQAGRGKDDERLYLLEVPARSRGVRARHLHRLHGLPCDRSLPAQSVPKLQRRNIHPHHPGPRNGLRGGD